MNGKAPRRPRESKKEAVCLCSHGGMRKCPRSVSNLSEGGQGTFSRRGKASRGRSSHRRARPRLHGPTRGYMEEKGEQRERRKSKGEAWFGEAWIKHLPLSSDPHHLLPPYTPTHKVAVRVRVRVFVKHSSSFTTSFSSPPPPSRLECLCLDWCRLRDEGYSLHRPTTCVAPAWSTGMRLMQYVFTQDTNASSAFCRTCRLHSIVLTA